MIPVQMQEDVISLTTQGTNGWGIKIKLPWSAETEHHNLNTGNLINIKVKHNET